MSQYATLSGESVMNKSSRLQSQSVGNEMNLALGHLCAHIG